jgi:hypothetical protein
MQDDSAIRQFSNGERAEQTAKNSTEASGEQTSGFNNHALETAHTEPKGANARCKGFLSIPGYTV